MSRSFPVRWRVPIAGAMVLLVLSAILMGVSDDARSQREAPPSNSQKSALLVAASLDEANLAPPRVYTDPAQMRARAVREIDKVPVPAGRRTAAEYSWTGIPGGVTDTDIRDLVQYRTSCDWFREFLESPSDETRTILGQIPQWPVFRASPFGERLERLIGDALAGDTAGLQEHVDRACVDHPELRQPPAS